MTSNFLPMSALTHPLVDLEPRVQKLETGYVNFQTTADGHTVRLDSIDQTLLKHSKILAEHSQTLAEHTQLLNEHSQDLAIIKQTLVEHTIRLDVLEDKVDRGFSSLENRFDRLEGWLQERF